MKLRRVPDARDQIAFEIAAGLGQIPPSDRQKQLIERCQADQELMELVLQIFPNLKTESIDVPQRLIGRAIPSVVDKYRVIDTIGEGGMGAVVLAKDPFDREVAIKFLRFEVSTQSDVKRFEHERRALAKLQHPNIAKIFDGGEYRGGPFPEPYLVMEYVRDGARITHFADQLRLDVHARLRLFQQVCEAIQHAHNNRIIHRDIKASNVLAHLLDGKPHTKLIDFGIAFSSDDIATDQSFIDTTTQRTVRARDQFQRESAVDLFALGVLLYEMLAGYRSGEHRRANVNLWNHDIVSHETLAGETPPPAPSAYVRDLIENKESSRLDVVQDLAGKRNTSPTRLIRILRGELDAIILRCFIKDPTLRYGSAQAIAADIDKYLLHDQAIDAFVASPALTPRLYRTRKLLRRNRVPIMLAAATVLLIFAGWYGNHTHTREEAAKRTTHDAIAAQNWNHYVADIRGVQILYNRGDFHRAQELLDSDVNAKDGEDFRGLEWYFWKYRLQHAGRQLNLPNCRSMTFGPEAKYFAASDGRSVTVWDLSKDKQIFTGKISNNDHVVEEPGIPHVGSRIAFSSDGHLLGCITSVYLSDNRLAGCLRVWETSRGKEIFSIQNDPTMRCGDLGFMPNSSVLIVDKHDPIPRRYDLTNNRVLLPPAHNQIAPWPVPNYVPSPWEIVLFNSPRGSLIARLSALQLQVVLVSPFVPPNYPIPPEDIHQIDPLHAYTCIATNDRDPHMLMGGATDGRIRWWEVDEFGHISGAGEYKALPFEVNSLAISSSRDWFAGADRTGAIVIEPTDLDDAVHMPINSRPIGVQTSNTFMSTDGQVVARFSPAPIWRLTFERVADHHVITTISDRNLSVMTVRYSPQGHFAAVSFGSAPDSNPSSLEYSSQQNMGGLGLSYQVHLIDLRNGVTVAKFMAPAFLRDLSLTFSDNDERFAVALDKNGIGWWDSASKTSSTLLPDIPVGIATLSPSGRYIAISGKNVTEVLPWLETKPIFRSDHAGSCFAFNSAENLLYFYGLFSSEGRSVVYDFLKQIELPNLFGTPVTGQFFFSNDGHRAYSLGGGRLSIFSTGDWSLITSIAVDGASEHSYYNTALIAAVDGLLADWRSNGLERNRLSRKPTTMPIRKFYVPQAGSVPPRLRP